MWHWLLYSVLCTLPGAQLKYITDHAMSIAAMRSLVDMESYFNAELDNYLDELEGKIATIESFLDDVLSKRMPWRNTPDELVAHPLTSFSLVRRLHEDWSHMELFMSRKVGLEYINNIQRVLDLAKPTEQDLQDALSGIDAIQSYYDLEPTDMAKGLLNGWQYNTSLTTLECLAMVEFQENNKQVYASTKWYEAALQQYDEERDGHLYREVFNFKLSDLYGNYAQSLATRGFRRTALRLLHNVSDLHADLWLLQREIMNEVDLHEQDDIQIKNYRNTEMIGCKGWFPPITNLICHYETRRTAFLRLAPLKVELLSLDPYVAIYHNAIYDTEIARVMTLPLADLKGPSRYSKRREYNMKFTTVHEEANSQLNQRIRDMTGAEVKEDKDFRIYNYGIGGYIRQHMDNLPEEDLKPGFGDYQTTIVYFLNDVTHGGAISFQSLQITAWPRKGSALVWHNLDNNLERDLRVAHTSCPVIVGSKWILVKWLHEAHQRFAQTL